MKLVSNETRPIVQEYRSPSICLQTHFQNEAMACVFLLRGGVGRITGYEASPVYLLDIDHFGVDWVDVVSHCTMGQV